MKTLILLLLVIKCIAGLQPRVDPLVSTPKGQIRGLRAEDGDYDKFLGIPYAVVDENDPFGPASPHPGFETTFEAYTDGTSCLQAGYGGSTAGTIHCLQLDIHVPRVASSTNTLPVIVNIHGGGFVTGEKSSQNPVFLMKHDVIFVSINYRLGIFGFLCASENRYKNQGLKDQVLAMEWVKEVIGSFGGDVNKITVMGHSAGAMSIDLQLYVHEKFADKAILMSGTGLGTWVLSAENDDIPINTAKALGYTGDNAKEAIEYLSLRDPAEVVEIAARLGLLSDADGHPLTTPCVEPIGNGALLTDYPVNLEPKVKGMDIMIGHTDKEVMFIYPKPENTNYYRNYDFKTELANEFNEVLDADTVKQFYIGDEEVNEKLQDEILDYGTDLAFIYPVQRSIAKYLNAGVSNLYSYSFSYEGGRNILKVVLDYQSPGACHGDDIGYLFQVPELEGQEISEEDQEMIEVMTKMWTDFAKQGNPTPASSQTFTWEPIVDASRRPYLSIGRPVAAQTRLFQDRVAFWDLYYELHGDKIKGVST
ncbi:unnamed protein product [Chrysodeixis includens]|uniref:Carboxylic ester hydrolase n=1 Tax=Chrysodeixis includens TaxID=689277 RepID=A0A9P0FXT3_CHRIL|nr:unnamed protein product [Chrysodeixis includens]